MSKTEISVHYTKQRLVELPTTYSQHFFKKRIKNNRLPQETVCFRTRKMQQLTAFLSPYLLFNTRRKPKIQMITMLRTNRRTKTQSGYSLQCISNTTSVKTPF